MGFTRVPQAWAHPEIQVNITMARRDVRPTGPCNNSSVHYVARSMKALKVSQFLGQRASELGMLPES